MAGLTLVLWVVVIAPASAETEMPGIGSGSQLGGALPRHESSGTGGGENGRQAPPVAAKPAKKVKHRSIKRCQKRHGVRTCRYYRGVVAKRFQYRVCRKRRGHHRHCKRRGAKATRSAPSAAMTAALDVLRHRRSLRSGSYGQGTLTDPMPAVVRLYFTVPVKRADGTVGTRTSSCSGSVLLSGVILTAGHCINANGPDGDGFRGYYDLSSYTVVPGNTVQSGQAVAPYGQWKVKNMWTTSAYADKDQLGADWGLVEVAPDANGRYPGQVVGTVSATWGQSIGSAGRLYNVGYSASGPFATGEYFGGNQQRYCDSYAQSGVDIYKPYNFQYKGGTNGNFYGIDMKPCWQNGGSSGGPVFYYGPQGWTVIGVNNRGSTGADGFGADMVTWWFDDDFGSFYNDVVGQINAGS